MGINNGIVRIFNGPPQNGAQRTRGCVNNSLQGTVNNGHLNGHGSCPEQPTISFRRHSIFNKVTSKNLLNQIVINIKRSPNSADN